MLKDTSNTLINFIEKNLDWVEKLSENPYHLKIKQHPTDDEIWMLSYDMIRSDFSQDIVKICRGIILRVKKMAIFDESRNYKKEPIEWVNQVTILVRAFDKFFNYGESQAAQIDWNKIIYAREKVDGSLIKFRNFKLSEFTYKPCWMTNNGFNANIPLPSDDLICPYNSFQEVINEALVNHNLKNLEAAGKNYTVMFELTSPFNRVVVKYAFPKLWLLGARDMKTQEELTPEFFKTKFDLDFDIPEVYELHSTEEAILKVQEMDTNHEGIVIQDINFNRIKIKSEQYLSIHRMKDSNGQLSKAHLLKCIQAGTVDDIISIFPEYTIEINKVIDLYNIISKKLDIVIKHAGILISCLDSDADGIVRDEKGKKKEYAMEIKDHIFSSVYFDLYKNYNNSSIIKENYLKELDFDKLVRLSND
jgi:T4 RnlA family RNA ligase